MKTCGPRKRRYKCSYHTRQKSQELRVCSIFAVPKRLPKGRLVREWRQWVDIREEVVDQEFKDAQGCDTLLCIHDNLSMGTAERDKRMGSILQRRRRAIVAQSSSLFGFSCSFRSSVRRTSSFLDTVIGTGNVELATRTARRGASFTLKRQTVSTTCKFDIYPITDSSSPTYLYFSLAAQVTGPWYPGVLFIGRR